MNHPNYDFELFQWVINKVRWDEERLYQVARTLQNKGERKLIKELDGNVQIWIRLRGTTWDEFLIQKVNLYEFIKVHDGEEESCVGFTLETNQ